jgi:hypothetical protein
MPAALAGRSGSGSPREGNDEPAGLDRAPPGACSPPGCAGWRGLAALAFVDSFEAQIGLWIVYGLWFLAGLFVQWRGLP